LTRTSNCVRQLECLEQAVRTTPSGITARWCSNKKPESAQSGWSRFLGKRPDLPKYSGAWWWEKFVICVVFAVTGSSTMVVCRPLLKDVLQLQGTMKDGPWSYRVAYISLITPIYSVILVSVGTIFGHHYFFKKMSLKIWARLIPPLKKYL